MSDWELKLYVVADAEMGDPMGRPAVTEFALPPSIAADLANALELGVNVGEGETQVVHLVAKYRWKVVK